MISAVMQLLKSKLAAFAAILIIILILAFGGPRFFPNWRWYFYGAAALVLIIFLIYLAIKTYRERKKARMLEGFLQQQADDQVLAAQPGVQDELAAIKEKLEAAIGVLKKSRLARGRRGSQALYVLPWYMIIGPSAAGKSTMLRNSGLQFPAVDSATDEPARVKGLGGTRNCDWWLSSQGIFLDTAGRYTVSAQGADDREEWSNFLEMLKKARGRAPINGLVLAVAIDEILREDDDGLDQLARTLRSRIDELIVKMQILFPIYVVFTKCDLIAGFAEYCGDFRRREREQVWGYTRRYEPSKRPLHEEFSREVAGLTTILEHRRLRQLQAAVRPVQKRGTYLFPVEFGAATRRLSRFVEILFQPNPYQQNPMVRGFYFNSGTQEGTPIAQVMAAMRRDFGLASDAPLPIEPVRETKAFFIKDLFQQVILPDESRVMPLTSAGKRRRLIRTAWNVAQAAAAGLLILALLNSYRKNGDYNEQLERRVQTADQVLRGESRYALTAMDTFDEFRDRLVQAEQGPDLWRRWGLYSGDPVIDSARAVYFNQYNRLVLTELTQVLGRELYESPAPQTEDAVDQYFQKATVYQMATLSYDSVSPDVLWLIEETNLLTRQRIVEEEQSQAGALVEDQAWYYWQHRREDREQGVYPQLRAMPDPKVLARIDMVMKDYWTVPRLYEHVIRDANAQFRYFSVDDAARSTILLTGGRVGGAFTREGWNDYVRPRIDTIAREINRSPLLKRAFQDHDPDDIKTRLREMYVRDFRSKWRSFLSSVSIEQFGDLADAAVALADLSTEDSPIIAVVKKVYEQGDLDKLDESIRRPIDLDFRPLGDFFDQGDGAGNSKSGAQAYLELLAELPKAVEDQQKLLESQTKCYLRLQDLDNEINDRQRRINRLIRTGGSALASAASDLLVSPLGMTQRAARVDGCRCLNRNWKTLIYDEYWSQFQRQYPFVDSDDDADYGAVVSFFKNKLRDFEREEVENIRSKGVGVSPGFSNASRAADNLQSIISTSSVRIEFSLEADLNLLSGLRTMTVKIAGKTFEYHMGPITSQTFHWKPGSGDVQLAITPEEMTLHPRPKRYPGDWSVLRFIDQATYNGRVGTWAFDVGGGRTLKASYRLGGSDAGLLIGGHFSQFSCEPCICGCP